MGWLDGSTWYSYLVGGREPQLFYDKEGYAAALLEACQTLKLPYAPPIYMRNRHLHLVSSTVFRKPLGPMGINPKYKRQIVESNDGGTVSIDWFRGVEAEHSLPAHAPIVVILHALAGSTMDPYVMYMCSAFFDKGWRPVGFNFRGCGSTNLTSAKCFSYADTADMYATVSTCQRMYPQAAVFAVGFSLGAYNLNKYIGEVDSGVYPEDGKLAGVAVLGSGFDFAAELEYQPGAYEWICVRMWRDYVKEHRDALAKHPDIDIDQILKCTTMRDIDQHLICKCHNYATPEDYYRDLNGLTWISKIETPTLFVSAEDDPFLDVRVAPKEECSKNPFTLFALTYDGSHCSHLSGLWPFGQSWLDHVVGEWFSAILALADSAAEPEDASTRSQSQDLPETTAGLSSESPSMPQESGSSESTTQSGAEGGSPRSSPGKPAPTTGLRNRGSGQQQQAGGSSPLPERPQHRRPGHGDRRRKLLQQMFHNHKRPEERQLSRFRKQMNLRGTSLGGTSRSLTPGGTRERPRSAGRQDPSKRRASPSCFLAPPSRDDSELGLGHTARPSLAELNVRGDSLEPLDSPRRRTSRIANSASQDNLLRTQLPPLRRPRLQRSHSNEEMSPSAQLAEQHAYEMSAQDITGAVADQGMRSRLNAMRVSDPGTSGTAAGIV